jgi:hypothetical protein
MRIYRPSPTENTVRLRLGRWLEVSGAGWGVAVVPLVMLLLAALAVLQLHP